MSDPTAFRTVFHRATGARTEPLLLILLPGFDMKAEDFVTHGLVEAARTCAPCADILIAEPDLDLYLDSTIGEQLVALVRAQRRGGSRRIWLAGISLGCFGGLLAAAQAAEIEGLILLAPFLGTPGLIAEVERAGGLAAWKPGKIAPEDQERRLLAWLKGYGEEPGARPLLYLGYGNSDRFAAASRLLAALLPPHRMCTVDGAHDWPSWSLLWRCILAADPFAPTRPTQG